jgi:hypothetical protein
VTWKLPGSHTATPRETSGNPKGECGGCTKSYTPGAGYIADCNALQQAVQPGPLFQQGWFLGGTKSSAAFKLQQDSFLNKLKDR